MKNVQSAVDPECAEIPDFKCNGPKDMCCRLPIDIFDKATADKCMNEVKSIKEDNLLGVCVGLIKI